MTEKIKVGIEIHQQLDTCCKLFCGCPTRLSDEEPNFSVIRRLKPTHSEMGTLDSAVLFESIRQKTFTYQGYHNLVCLVELDEEPPHGLNDEAVSIALSVAALTHMIPVDEVHVMRKIVIDGSNTSGFQRTALIATDGYIETTRGRVNVPTICLEEEAAPAEERHF